LESAFLFGDVHCRPGWELFSPEPIGTIDGEPTDGSRCSSLSLSMGAGVFRCVVCAYVSLILLRWPWFVATISEERRNGAVYMEEVVPISIFGYITTKSGNTLNWSHLNGTAEHALYLVSDKLCLT
jgi:hypothetical protein